MNKYSVLLEYIVNELEHNVFMKLPQKDIVIFFYDYY